MNQHCNDLSIDTIETGAMMAVLMDAGLTKFGNVALTKCCAPQLETGFVETGLQPAVGFEPC
jgi:hypothetical protein